MSPCFAGGVECSSGPGTRGHPEISIAAVSTTHIQSSKPFLRFVDGLNACFLPRLA